MARRIRAVRFVLDGPDQAQNPRAVRGFVNPQTVRPVQTRKRLSLGVAGVTGFPFLVDESSHFGRISGKRDVAFPVENANPRDARFVPDGVDDVKNFFALVAQHRVSNAAPDDIAGSISALEDHFLLRLAQNVQVPVPVQPQQQGHAADHADSQLRRQVVSEPTHWCSASSPNGMDTAAGDTPRETRLPHGSTLKGPNTCHAISTCGPRLGRLSGSESCSGTSGCIAPGCPLLPFGAHNGYSASNTFR